MEFKNLDVILYDIRMFLNNNEEFENMDIQYALINTKDINKSIVVASDDETVVEIKYDSKDFNLYYDWSYSIDTEIFENLESDFEIGFMSDDWHYNIWFMLEDLTIEEIENKVGLQKYLQYCKDNEINKKYLENGFKKDVFDIMQYYDENKNYIQIENEQVKMSKEMYQKENEINYITFVLGYDLLNDMINKSESNECDVAYDFCNYIARKFIETDYYKNEKYSTYEMLQKWINDNKDIIQSEHLFYNGIENKLILQVGKRNNEKVALVERKTEYGKEFVIAFNYAINDKKLEWGYGYYYDKDLEKANKDFEKVKAGGNLADTFIEKSKNKNKERDR